MTKPRAISIDTVRRLAIEKQQLVRRPESTDKDTLEQIIWHIGLLQLDSISVTARSHYLVMLARAGLYDVADLDALLPERFLFEYWAHAACLIPMKDLEYFEPRMRIRTREQYAGWFKRMGNDPDALLQLVKDEIEARGPLSSKDFDTPRPGKGGWWNLKPAKYALEYLFETGELMIDRRESFRRYYDLANRVLAHTDDTYDHTVDDYRRWATLNGLRHIGVGTIPHIGDYYRVSRSKTGHAKQHLEALMAEEAVIEVEVTGWEEPAYIYHRDLERIDELEDSSDESQLTVFLSPFDNLIWHRERTEALFDFYYRIEVYTPKEQRKYGYYVLPILHNGQLVGRIDPKINRKQKQFIIHALHLEPGVTVDDALVDGLTGAIREFMQFHNCATVTITRCDDAPDLKDALLSRLPTK